MNSTDEPTSGLSSSTRNHAPPAAASSGPKRLAGRRAHATAPHATSAHPTAGSASAAPVDGPASELSLPPRTTRTASTPSASPAAATAT